MDCANFTQIYELTWRWGKEGGDPFAFDLRRHLFSSSSSSTVDLS